MKKTAEWLLAYGECHQNPVNQKIHTLCVPLIFFCMVGAFLMLPGEWHGLRIGYALLSACLFWYSLLGLRPFLLMTTQMGIASLLFTEMAAHSSPGPWLGAIFVAAWIAQFWGHWIEGKKPSFFRDLQFLLIGPLWIWSKRIRLA